MVNTREKNPVPFQKFIMDNLVRRLHRTEGVFLRGKPQPLLYRFIKSLRLTVSSLGFILVVAIVEGGANILQMQAEFQVNLLRNGLH